MPPERALPTVALALLCLALPAMGIQARAPEPVLSSGPAVTPISAPLCCQPQFGHPELLLTHPGAGHPEPLFVEDFTWDGHPDVLSMINEWGGSADLRPILLASDGAGSFVEATTSVFIGQPPWLAVPREVLVADFNDDGHPDLFVADHGCDWPPHPGHQNSLILSAPGGKLIDATANLPQQLDFAHCTKTADIDGDDDLDLFIGNIWGRSDIGPQLWLNDGNGAFAVGGQLPAEHASLSEHGYTTCLLADVTGEGAPDLILGGSGEFHDRTGGLSHILRNDGQGHFSELAGALPPKLWFPTDLALDIQPTDLNGDGAFRDETAARLPQSLNADLYVPFLELLDLDYDGDMDMAPIGLFDGGAPPFYVNDGQGYFHPLRAATGLLALCVCHAGRQRPPRHPLPFRWRRRPSRQVLRAARQGLPARLPATDPQLPQ